MLRAEKLWLISIALRERGHLRLAGWVKKLNTLLYHNFLPIEASVSPDLRFGHQGYGVMVHGSIVIGKRVKIYHHVTLTVSGMPGVPSKLIIEDDVKIGANSVIITPRGESLRIGRGARIGAGTVVTEDVPPGATVVSAPARVLTTRAARRLDKLSGVADS